jgi:hypothetical protein
MNESAYDIPRLPVYRPETRNDAIETSYRHRRIAGTAATAIFLRRRVRESMNRRDDNHVFE